MYMERLFFQETYERIKDLSPQACETRYKFLKIILAFFLSVNPLNTFKES